MAKLFCFGDCHGFYDELVKALDEAGFDKNNNDHWLIGCGDYLDRGRQPTEIIEFLDGIENKVLCAGNHEGLTLDCLKRGTSFMHDYHNGTTQTIIDIAQHYDEKCTEFGDMCEVVKPIFYQFIAPMKNYFETKNYVFVHSSIPSICNDGLPKHYTRDRKFEYDPDWRNADQDAWESAKWGNPFDLVKQGILPENKILVFGHWHTSYAWGQDEGRSEFGSDAKFDPYFGDGYIGLDGCTAASGKVNIVVLEDKFLE